MSLILSKYCTKSIYIKVNDMKASTDLWKHIVDGAYENSEKVMLICIIWVVY